jgi:Uma2 family endonuclease
MSISIPQTRSVTGPPAGRPEDVIWRLSVEQYHEMIRAGILTSDDPVELLEGWLVCKMPKSPSHRISVRLTRDALQAVVPAGWYVDSQEPITLADSEPEPDVTVIRGETRDYFDRHPGPTDLALVVEVADTTLERDRRVKKRLYALAGLVIYWIINLSELLVEVYTEPSGPAEEPDYRERRDYGVDDSVPVVIEGREVGRIDVRELLPR